MGCISVCTRKVETTPYTRVCKRKGIYVATGKICQILSCCISFMHRLFVSVCCKEGARVALSYNNNFHVSTGLVCTVNVGTSDIDNTEMWWCDQWRVLWNNGIKALWVN